MAGYSYSDWVTAVGGLLELTVNDPTSAAPFTTDAADYNNAIPRAIEYAEQRIYRELDLLMTRQTDTSGSLTANNRAFTVPNSSGGGWIIGSTLIGSQIGLGGAPGSVFIVLEQVALFVNGQRQAPLLLVSKDSLEACWPSDTSTTTPSVPTQWCQVDQLSILVAPPPDQAYQVQCFGTKRPSPLSSINTSTILTTYLPDLFLIATMIYWQAFQRDLNQQSDNPGSTIAWMAFYDAAFKSAGVEELRKMSRSSDYSNRIPSPITQPLPR